MSLNNLDATCRFTLNISTILTSLVAVTCCSQCFSI